MYYIGIKQIKKLLAEKVKIERIGGKYYEVYK